MAHLLEKRGSALLVLRRGVMTMVISFLSSVGGCGGGHGISSKEEEVCHSSPKKERGRPRSFFNL